ncbi:MAG: GNAT family N-acetyltransferase [Acidobacteriota bacterium]|nr:GNAT family N-acetyltransferase [Acidobacteriota bacterium]
MQVEIRTATTDDLAVLRDLYRRSSLSNDSDRELLGRRPELLEWPADAVATGGTRVAVVGGRLVGFSTLVPHGATGEVDDLFVDPEWMRRGIGRRLVEDMAATAAAAGVDALEVDANPAALTFYEGVGFAGIGEARLLHGHGVRMRLPVRRKGPERDR